MSKYLAEFNSHADYIIAKNNNEISYPNVSYDNEEFHYTEFGPDIVEDNTDYSLQYLTFEALTPGTVTMKCGASTNNHISDMAGKTISYSTDNGETWSNYTTSTTETTIVTLANKGDKVLFKGTNDNYGNSNNAYVAFYGTAYIKVYGNIMSLIYGNNFINQLSLPSVGNNFKQLFYGNKRLVDAENLILPATTIYASCYQSMFSGCDSLVKGPEKLPALSLPNYCYYGMFYNCYSLENIPELSATTLSGNFCCQLMFASCTSLKNLPPILLPETLSDYCYQDMFNGCRNAEGPIVLPAQTLNKSNSYLRMFAGCRKLNHITMLATSVTGSGSLTNWVNGVAYTGTFIKDSSLTLSTDSNGIPRNWTVETL